MQPVLNACMDESFNKIDENLAALRDPKEGEYRRCQGLRTFITRWGAISCRILLAYQMALRWFGLFLCRKPSVVVAIFLMFVTASCVGFSRLHVVKPSETFFTATKNQARKDSHIAAEVFPFLNAREEELILVPRYNQNVLSEDCLSDALLLHNVIVKIKDYQDICEKLMIPVRKRNNSCSISSPLEVCGTQAEDIKMLPTVLLHEQEIPTGQAINSSLYNMLSNFRIEKNNEEFTPWADAMRMVFYLKNPENEVDVKKVLQFEASLENQVSSIKEKLKCVSVSWKTGRATSDALKAVLKPKLLPLYLSSLTMMLFMVLLVFFSTVYLNFLSVVALFVVSFVLPCAGTLGLVSLAGLPLLPTALFVPFLLLGISASYLILILKELERQRSVLSVEHRIAICVSKTGFPLVTSSLCGAILFGIAIKSSFEVISNFFILTLVVFVLMSLSIKTIAVVQLIYFTNEFTIGDSYHFKCCEVRAIQHLNENLAKGVRATFRILASRVGRIISALFFVCILFMSIMSALTENERIGTAEELCQDENYKDFNRAIEMFFDKEIDASLVFIGSYNYSQDAVQKKLTMICENLGKAHYSERETKCWTAALNVWAKTQNASCSGEYFSQCLEKFLSSVRNVPYRQDMQLDSTFHVKASRIHLFMTKRNQLEADSRSLEGLRTDLANEMHLQAVPFSEDFILLDNLILLQKETFEVLLLAGIGIFVFSVMSSASFVVSIYLTVTYILLVAEAAAVMQVWHIHLNQISFVSLFVGIIVSQSYNIQVAHAFVSLQKRNAVERVVEALSCVSIPVVCSAVLSVASSCSLGFIFPSAKDIFTLLIPVTIGFGVFHALVILLPLISVTFELFAKCFGPDGSIKGFFAHEHREDIIDCTQAGNFRQDKPKRPGIAIAGISCRFPGANSKEMFWDMLVSGKSNISEYPKNRVEEYNIFNALYHPKRFVSGRLCATKGSYLEEIQSFDNTFFGISNQEARAMDPQQRILLQVVYEAIEDAGMRLEDLQNCSTGVFVGVMNLEFGALVTNPSNYKNIDQFSSTGMTASIIANRVSFCLNLTGPSVAVDTACSSSLTALKIACDNLLNGDCDVAIVCAPNVVLNHAMQIVSSMAGLLAPDGRCKSFDASGDGYGRGEGFAAVLLKLTAVALSDGDDIYCEIVACGMNNDGQNAVPITAPSSKMQAQLSKRVLEQSGISPENVDYFEAHGTGTAIGDVVETDSIADTYTRVRVRKLRVGSVKSNLNHTESTSGLAGLVKVALMIKHGKFVPTVNIHTLNQKLKLDEKGIVVQEICEDWTTQNGKPRIGALNSFGYGGSNVHVIVQEVKSVQPMTCKERERLNYVLTISARSKEALQRMAELYSIWLKDYVPDKDRALTSNVCYSLNERRSRLPYRLALSFDVSSQASQSLLAYAQKSVGWEKVVSYGDDTSCDQDFVFMFGGQGSQWYGMGRQLIEAEPVFKDSILRVNSIIKSFGEKWSLYHELMATEGKSRIAENWLAQPATFAVQYATAQLLMSWGIYPSAVVGHSLGEFAAATIARIITVKEAVQVVLTRSKLQEKCPNNGAMAALGMSDEDARGMLEELRLSNTLEVAAVNDANSVTVSGDFESVEALGDHLKMHASGVFWRVLGTKRAFHSFHMEHIKNSFQEAAKGLKLNPQLSKIPMYSTVTGEVISGQELNGDYWWLNIRCPVRFYEATKLLLKDGHRQVIEISTQPILAHYVQQIAVQENFEEEPRPAILETLPRKKVALDAQHRCFLQNTVCKLYSLGYPIDFNLVQGEPYAKLIRSPTYPWQENSFWYREHTPHRIIQPVGDENSPTAHHSATAYQQSDLHSLREPSHPFLGKVKKTPPFSGLRCWDTEIDLHRFPSLRDHTLLQGGTVMPGAAYLEMVLAMIKDTFVIAKGLQLTDVKLSSLLTLPETQVRTLRLRLIKTENVGEAQFQITSVQDDKSEILLCSGCVTADLLQKTQHVNSPASGLLGPAVSELIARMKKMPIERFREVTERYGFKYGPTFSVIKQVWQHDSEGLCLVDISQTEVILQEARNYVIHPSILDACLQSCFIPLGSSMMEDKAIVPVGFQSITVNEIRGCTQLFCHVTAIQHGLFNVILMNPNGEVLLTMCEFRIAELTNLPRHVSFSELLYEEQWNEESLASQRKALAGMVCIVLKGSGEFSDVLIKRLRTKRVQVVTIDLPKSGHVDSEAKKMITASFDKAMRSNNSPNIRVINLWPVETALLQDVFCNINQTQSLAFFSSVFLIKLLIEAKRHDVRLFLITLRTQLVAPCTCYRGDRYMPWGATVWGLRRTANLEEPNMRVTAVDLSDTIGLHEANALVDEILGESAEDEVAFRDGKRFINRVVRTQLSKEYCGVACPIQKDNKDELCLAVASSSNQFCLRRQSAVEPTRTEVKVKILFSWTPSESLSDLTKPHNCVFVGGIVTGLLKDTVESLQKGKEVCAIISSGRVGGFISLPESHCFEKPDYLSQEQAAYIPGCVAVAFHALQRMSTEEQYHKVLIHEANRGPGPAAVLLATAMSLRVVCTIMDSCSSSSKNVLLNMGAESVINQGSSDLDDDSVGQFDAALFFYQPSSNAFLKTTRALRKGGKLLILSSKFEGNIVLSANRHIKYEREDARDILLSPSVFEELSKNGLELLQSKGLLRKLLELEVKSLSLVETMRMINEGDQAESKELYNPNSSNSISFTVHSFAPVTSDKRTSHFEDIVVLPRGLDECGLKEDRTYLVAGGMRGFGFEVAKWMAENGAKTIGLLGRSKPSDGTREEVTRMETKLGVKVHFFQVDISNQEQMTSFSKQLESLPSVAGIVHTAMVLRDELIKDISFENFVDVMGPKIKGSFLLHQMSLKMELDFFVMFSSMASIVGNMGQASYSASNAFQDSLAVYRRHVIGIPGLSINWGPISGAGVMEREIGVSKLLTFAGLGFIDAKAGAKHMAKVLIENPGRSQISMFNADWPRFLKSNAGLRKTPRLADISAESSNSDSKVSLTESLAQRIVLENDTNKRAQLVNEYVSVSVTEWTGISSPSELDLNKSLYSYGVDSTVALTLKMQLETNLQVSFEVFYFMQPDTTPLTMAADIAEKLSGQRLRSESNNQRSQINNPSNGTEAKASWSETAALPTTSGSHVKVVPLYTPTGAAVKFFCVHPSHRYALSLVPISTGFQGQDLISFYALGFINPTAVSEDWGGVRQLATHYVQLIRDVQRHGPYFLGGYSYGGVVAYEMASILTEKNQRVEIVAMIDTFPWSSSTAASTKRASVQAEDTFLKRNVEQRFENYLRKFALETLKMSDDEYHALKDERGPDLIIDELKRRSLEQNVSTYDLKALKDSLLKDHAIASRTHRQWQPTDIRYQGPLVYLQCENTQFSPKRSSRGTARDAWGKLVAGGITVLVCPGNHFSMSELPHAHVTGGILATTLLFGYRTLFPDFPRPPRTFSQRRAVEKLCRGVEVFFHSMKGNDKPYVGELCLDERRWKLLLRSKHENYEKKVKAIVHLKDLRTVQPGKFVSSSLQQSGKVRTVRPYQCGDLGQMVAVITRDRVYSFEFIEVSDLKAFYNTIEALYSITINR